MAQRLIVEKPPIQLPYNWRDPSHYDYTDTHSPYQWAWEFLRRNPQYQHDWIVTSKEQRAKYPKARPSDIIEAPHAYDRWRIQQLIDPLAVDLDFTVLTQHMGFFPPYGRVFPGSGGIEVQKNRIALDIQRFDIKQNAIGVFDLTWDLESQWELVKPKLAEMQKDRELDIQRTYSSRYKQYLRIIDALHSDATTEEIVKLKYAPTNYADPRKSFYNDRKAALALLDGKYRKIAKEK